MSRDRWAIRVTYANGDEAWLRHGAAVGAGPIVKFTTRRTADLNVDLISPGLDDGAIITVVRFHRGCEQPPSADAVDPTLTSSPKGPTRV